MRKSEGKKSHYQRVIEILDAADRESTSDYGGVGKFWRLPLEEFKTVKVCGVQMIAPLSGDGQSTGNAAYMAGIAQRRRPYDYQQSNSADGEASSCCSSDKTEESVPKPKGASRSDTGAHSDAATNDPSQTGRGAASGLIKALKGGIPFDNRHYQRFMWDGKTVSDSDIQLVSNWIDDGCPETDAAVTSGSASISSSHQAGLVSGSIGHPAETGKTWNQTQAENGGLKQRKNAESLTPTEIENLREAVGELMALNKFPMDKRSYNSWGQIHGDTCQHSWELFLPWHRIYVYNFEQALQDISPNVTLPYWDWPMAAYNNGLPPSGNQYGSGITPTIYRAFLTADSIKRLKQVSMPEKYLDKLESMIGVRFNSGTTLFDKAGLRYTGKNDDEVARWRDVLSEELQLTNPLWHRLRYPGQFYEGGNLVDEGNPMALLLHQHYPAQKDMDQLMTISNWPDFGGGSYINQSFGLLNLQSHNAMHLWAGGENPDHQSQPDNPNEPAIGEMAINLTAGFDPIFWGHHSNIDRLWAEWQGLHPGLNPSDPDDVLAPFGVKVQESIDYTKLGYEYVKDSYHYPTSSEMGLNKFHSEDAGVKPHVLPRHNRAEVRIQGLRQPEESHYIRVFLNQPDAGAETPTLDNDNYVGGMTLFGHGPCIGGPGHCDDPPQNTRKFDIRGRHHNTPSNLKLDATQTIQKLMASGATDFSVQIIALCGSGKMGKHTLNMDGVSLHFFD